MGANIYIYTHNINKTVQRLQSLQSLQFFGLINYEKAWNLSEEIRIFIIL